MRGSEGARVGPNAALQLIAPLGAAAPQVFARADLSHWLTAPPEAMIDQADAARLHRAVRDALPGAEAEAALCAAGRATADYLLGRRIPKPVQLALRGLPRALAARALTRAIGVHAWTFAGSGRFRAEVGREIVFEIADNPLAGGASCVWHAAVFERLFGRLVASEARAQETQCGAAGAPCCRFVIGW